MAIIENQERPSPEQGESVALARDVVVSVANAAQLAYRQDAANFRSAAAEKYTGKDAWKGVREVVDYNSRRGDEIESQLEYRESRELFARNRELAAERNRAFAARFAAQETENYRRQVIEALNRQTLEDVSQAPGSAQTAFLELDANGRELHRNMTPEYIQGQSDNVFLDIVDRATQSLLTQDPDAAGMFLNEDWVRERATRSPGVQERLDEIRGNVDATRENALASRHAMAVAESGAGDDDIDRMAKEQFPDDERMATVFSAVGKDHARAMRNADAREKFDARASSWKKLAETDYSLGSLPADFTNQHPLQFRDMADFSSWMNRPDAEKLSPDFNYQDRLMSMRRDELVNWLADDGNFTHMMKKMAGKWPEINRVIDYANGKTEAAGKKGFDAAALFERAYPSLYKTLPPKDFSVEKSRAYMRENGFRHIFADRAASHVADGKTLTDDDRKAIAFGILRDARSGFVSLDTEVYQADTHHATQFPGLNP